MNNKQIKLISLCHKNFLTHMRRARIEGTTKAYRDKESKEAKFWLEQQKLFLKGRL